MIIDKYLENYKDFEVEGNSYKQYRQQIERLYSFMCNIKGISDEIELIKSITIEDAEEFELYIKSKDYKLSTKNLIFIICKDYFKYLHIKRKLIPFNPFDIIELYSIEDVRRNIKRKETLEIEEVKNIIESINKVNFREKKINIARDKFLISLLFCTGMRISECLSIKMDWIERYNNGYIINIPYTVVKNKIDKAVPIPSSILGYYEEYIESRKKIIDIDENLFKLSRYQARRIIKKYTDRADIEKNISPHSFRASLTKELNNNNVSVSLQKNILGWKDNDITSVYNGGCNDKRYNQVKLDLCNLLV